MYKDEVKRHQFFKMPKWLFDDGFKTLSVNAKVMYMLMFDRLSLSVKNRWYDDDGRLYLYFTNEQFMTTLSFSEKTIIKSKKELTNFGLLYEVRQGVNKPNRLYINGTVKSTGQELENLQHGTVKSTGQELENLQGTKTDITKTDITKTDISKSASTTGLTLRDFFDSYENEIGRLLSPFEIEDFSKWHQEDKVAIEIMYMALKEAVSHNKVSSRYITSILRNWCRLNLTTVKAVENHLLAFEKGKTTKARVASATNVPEWSNPDYKAPDLDSLKVEVPDGYVEDPDAF